MRINQRVARFSLRSSASFVGWWWWLRRMLALGVLSVSWMPISTNTCTSSSQSLWIHFAWASSSSSSSSSPWGNKARLQGGRRTMTMTRYRTASRATASSMTATATAASPRTLGFWESMMCGAVSKSVAKTITHPANTLKTILQTARTQNNDVCTSATCSKITSALASPSSSSQSTTELAAAAASKGAAMSSSASSSSSALAVVQRPSYNFRVLTRGAGAQFLLSGMLGAVNFAVLEFTRDRMEAAVGRMRIHLQTRQRKGNGSSNNKIGFFPFSTNPTATAAGGINKVGSRKTLSNNVLGAGMDLMASTVSTFVSSVVSVPQMVIMDNIMAGTYPNLRAAVSELASEGGMRAFYRGWWPHLTVKIPSYAMSWMFFQQLKAAHANTFHRRPRDIENVLMGCVASGACVALILPFETVKTRLVTQSLLYPDLVPYKGMMDGLSRMIHEEGIRSLYLGLSPRLASVVPMMGAQFGVYEFMKRACLSEKDDDDDANDVRIRIRARDSPTLRWLRMSTLTKGKQPGEANDGTRANG